MLQIIFFLTSEKINSFLKRLMCLSVRPYVYVCILCVCVCVCVCVCTRTHTHSAHTVWKRVLDPLELKFWVVMSHYVAVKSRSPSRAASALNC